jgi:predicted transcriptional regulator YdeE/DNA-binding transcriptional MerR regulator
MIKIGDFSKLAHVTVKTLHHYGELGLLQPAHVDRYTGYRYYTFDQLGDINRILALKDLGFSLEQVAQLLEEDLSIEEMRGMLRMKRMELARTLSTEQARLESVEQRLLQLAQDGRLPNQEVAIKAVPAQTVLSVKAVAANEMLIQPTRKSLQLMLWNHLQRAQLKPATPWFSLVDNNPFSEYDLEVELAVGVNLRKGKRAANWGDSPIRLKELPATKSMACIVYQGPVATLYHAYTQLYAWTQANGYQISGAIREVYLSPSNVITTKPTNLDDSFTELQCPVRRASIPISVQSPLKRKESIIMKPKIVTKPAFRTAGISYIGKNQSGEIPQLWGIFNSRYNQIPAINDICYGLCFSNAAGAAEGEFEYIAATEVKDDNNVPEGMVYREVPEYKYAIFTHYGKLDTLGETYEFIYNTWLPQSGLNVHPDHFDMELYDERFMPDSDDSEFDIYIAIQ